MLRRLEIKNYRCFSDVSIEFGKVNLLLGLNGSGKSTVIDALQGLRELIVHDRKVEEVFPSSTLPRRQMIDAESMEQVFSLEFVFAEVSFTYEIRIRHDRTRQIPESTSTGIHLERVWLDRTDETLLERGWNLGRVTRRDGGVDQVLVSPNRSILPSVPDSEGFPEVHRLRTLLKESVFCLRLNPARIYDTAGIGSVMPAVDFENFADWLRTMSAQAPQARVGLEEAMKGIMHGFDHFGYQHFDINRSKLFANMQPREPMGYPIYFSEFSDGQKSLVILYAILHFLLKSGATVCIDEPENNLAISEIQPWLLEALDAVEEHKGQLILASHHPEFMDFLAPDHGIVFKRDESGMAIVEKFQVPPNTMLPASELAARGEIL